MANAQKMIEERKKSLQPPAAVKVATNSTDDHARKIAELQAKINSKLNTSTIANLKLTLPVPSIQSTATNGSTDEPKPGPLILNAEGRTVDALGREVLLPQHTPTLKANTRAKKREVLKTHLTKGALPGREETGTIGDSPFFRSSGQHEISPACQAVISLPRKRQIPT